ncbi:RNA polymerase sigma factor [Fibrobacter sp. HC4]|uniref:RNA polymerase sigma factor n=1 Tax=Fibrobacter sp. HC4 TaxID=3239812 RepID=UPI002018C5AC|nr:sigma-70 family RNA polymerase sigma factor [Fibrobacter succinogenes]MCL4101993.1 RNA polymerase sigma-H factor [Fibrobacter succinogenes]
MNTNLVESTIIQKLKLGSREALALLWQDHSKNVLNLAFRMMKDRDQAEDILMDVFVQIPKAIHKFRGESALNTWLYKLTVNACLMKLRAQKRHSELESENALLIIEEALGQNEGENIDIPGRTQNEAEHYDPELLSQGLNTLPAETRSMLWLKDAEDLDIKDLSEVYNLPEGTIKAKLSRARHRIKDFIRERIHHAKQA